MDASPRAPVPMLVIEDPGDWIVGDTVSQHFTKATTVTDHPPPAAGRLNMKFHSSTFKRKIRRSSLDTIHLLDSVHALHCAICLNVAAVYSHHSC
jgi:hypothetical protein